MSSKNTVVPFGTRQEARLRLKPGPLRKEIRAREPVRRTTGRVVGFYPSTKNNRLVAWESQLEQKACALFEFSPDVVRYREQPISVYFESDGQMRRYTPDFELQFQDGRSIYLEVKPLAKLQNADLKRRFQQVARFWKLNGRQFGVITDVELYHPALQLNLKLLRAHQRASYLRCGATARRALGRHRRPCHFRATSRATELTNTGLCADCPASPARRSFHSFFSYYHTAFTVGYRP